MNRLGSGVMISILAMAVMPASHAAEASVGNKLVVAALRGDSTEVRKLLSKGASPNFADMPRSSKFGGMRSLPSRPQAEVRPRSCASC